MANTEGPETFVPSICAEGDVFNAFGDFQVLDQLTDGFTVASHEPGYRRIFWANEAACKFMMKAPLEALQKLDLEKGASPGMLKFGQMVYETVQVNKKPMQFPKTVYFGGKPTSITIHSHPIQVKLPGIEKVKVCVLDKIVWEDSKKIELEEKAKAHQLGFELLTNVDCNIISFHKEQQEIVYQNHFARTFYGESLSENCSISEWLDLCHFEAGGGRRSELLAEIQALQIHSPLIKFECYVDKGTVGGASESDCDSEGRVWHSVLVRAIYDPNTGDLCLMVQEIVVTALKQAQLDVLRAQQERELFFVSISHDLRSPLNGLVGLTSSLLMDPKIPAAQRNTLRVIMNSGERLVGLVNDILDAGAIASGAFTVKHEVVDLAQVAREVVEVARPLVKKGVKVSSAVDESVPLLRGDGGRIHQILMNLVANAAKFTAAGSITVAAEEDKEQGLVRIEVADTGLGIPEDKRAGVWEPFRQVDEETTRKYGGTGLGLSLVRSLVEAHGGQWGVDSKFGGPGSGSTFWFTIPSAEECEQDDDGEAGPGGAGQDWSPLRMSGDRVSRDSATERSESVPSESGSRRSSRSSRPGSHRQRRPLEMGRADVTAELAQQLEKEKADRVALEAERDELATRVATLSAEVERLKEQFAPAALQRGLGGQASGSGWNGRRETGGVQGGMASASAGLGGHVGGEEGGGGRREGGGGGAGPWQRERVEGEEPGGRRPGIDGLNGHERARGVGEGFERGEGNGVYGF